MSTRLLLHRDRPLDHPPRGQPRLRREPLRRPHRQGRTTASRSTRCATSTPSARSSCRPCSIVSHLPAVRLRQAGAGQRLAPAQTPVAVALRLAGRARRSTSSCSASACRASCDSEVHARPAATTSARVRIFNVGLYFGLVNLMLAAFNLLPIPPLDGSAIIERFIPTRHLPSYYQLRAARAARRHGAASSCNALVVPRRHHVRSADLEQLVAQPALDARGPSRAPRARRPARRRSRRARRRARRSRAAAPGSARSSR